MQCRQSLRLLVCEREQRKEAYREGMWDQRRVGLFFRTGDIIACLSADGRRKVNFIEEREGDYTHNVLERGWYPAPQWRGWLP